MAGVTCAGRCNFVHRSSAVGPADIRCAIEVAVGRLNESRLWIRSFARRRIETVQRGELAGSSYFEHGS